MPTFSPITSHSLGASFFNRVLLRCEIDPASAIACAQLRDGPTRRLSTCKPGRPAPARRWFVRETNKFSADVSTSPRKKAPAGAALACDRKPDEGMTANAATTVTIEITRANIRREALVLRVGKLASCTTSPRLAQSVSVSLLMQAFCPETLEDTPQCVLGNMVGGFR